MGCGGSSLVKDEDNEQDQQQKQQQAQKAPAGEEKKAADGIAAGATGSVEDDKEGDGKKGDKGGKSSTRARRLSYVTGDANGVAKHDGGAAPAAPAPPAASHPANAARSQSEKTRGRRLSYISKDANVMPVPLDGQEEEEEQEEETLEEGGASMAVGAAKAETTPLRVSVACMSRAGKEPGFKKTNQDNCFAFEKYITEDQSLFGAMDGHGPHGHLVSGFVKQHLPIILVNHLTSQKDVQKALTAGFIEVDKSLGGSRIDCEFSGSTAVVSYLKGKTLTTAWVGDSRGVMGRHTPQTGWQAVDLTNDHKPTNPEEKARILRSNGRVERLVDELGQPMGPYRVWLQYAWIPGLAMSRALGDVLAHQVGVASEPEHSVHELDPTYKFMILASDGVWEFISSKEAVEIVAQYDTVEEACRQLVDEAYQRWLTEEEGVVDDITAVVVRFLHEESS